MKLVAGTPAQTLLCLTEAQIMNEVATWVGRPGLFLGIPMSATTPLTLMSVFSSGLYNKHNCCMPVQVLQDMRINYDRFNQAYFAQQHGIQPWMSSSPTLYAYLTGPEQGAVEIIAHTLGMMAYSGGTLTQAMSVSVHGTYTGNDITWCNSAAALAAERNLRCRGSASGGTGDAHGALRRRRLVRHGGRRASPPAFRAWKGMWLAGGADGLEASWAGEMARAAAGLAVERWHRDDQGDRHEGAGAESSEGALARSLRPGDAEASRGVPRPISEVHADLQGHGSRLSDLGDAEIENEKMADDMPTCGKRCPSSDRKKRRR